MDKFFSKRKNTKNNQESVVNKESEVINHQSK